MKTLKDEKGGLGKASRISSVADKVDRLEREVGKLQMQFTRLEAVLSGKKVPQLLEEDEKEAGGVEGGTVQERE